MKNLIVLIIAVFASMPFASAQFLLDFDDPSTYSTTCGIIVGSQWKVSNASCSLLIPDLIVTDPLQTDVSASFIINRSGNMEYEDSMVLMHSVNGGAWITDTIVNGDAGSSVSTLIVDLSLSYLDTLSFLLVVENDNSSEFFAIKSGEIAIDNVTPKSSLPVELIYFEAEYDEFSGLINLSWATASEVNSSHFTLSRSTDARTFEDIAQIDAAGNSNTMVYYSYSDLPETNTATVYYRLTQVDFDGTSYIKDMIVVSIDKDLQMVEVLSSDNYFISNVSVPKNENAVLSIIDLSGKVLYESTIDAFSPIIRIDAELIPNQIYLLNVSSSHGVETVKFYAR